MKTVTVDSIKTDDALEIEILYNGKRKIFPSVVKEFIDDAVLISPIVIGGKAVGFPEELKTRFSVVVKGTPYVWSDPKIRLVKYAGNMYHMVSLPGEGNYVNRRQAYRQYVGEEMPITLWCFTACACALIGIPPASGFISKWYLAIGALETEMPVVSWLGPVILLVSALLTAGYLLPIAIDGFFPGPDFDYAQLEKKDPTKQMLVPIMLLAALAILLGVFPNYFINYMSDLVQMIF